MASTIEITAHALNIRDGAGTNYPASSALTQHQQAVVDTFAYNTWLHVTSPHVGYLWPGTASAPNVALLDVSVPLPNGSAKVKTTTALNVRLGPGTNYAVLFTLDYNQVVAVDPTKTVNGWYHIAGTPNQWIFAAYTVPVDGDTPAPVPTSPPTPVPLPPSLPWSLPFSATMRGVGTNTGGWVPGPNELATIKANDVQVALMVAYNANVAAQAIPALQQAGIKAFIVRASTYEPITTAQRFLDLTMPILREYYATLGNPQNMMIALHNEPNLISEGLGKGWSDGAGFATFFATVAQTYRAAFPGCKIGYPALSPGAGVLGVREDERAFAQQSIAAIRAADWLGLHAYWANQDASDFNPEVTFWKQFGKPVVGTEIGPVGGAVVTPATVLSAYAKLAAGGVPCMAWVLNGTGNFQNADWTANGLRL
jgi:uncharacterized protein YraI